MPLLFYSLSRHIDLLQDTLGVKTDVFSLKIFITTQDLL